MVERCEVVVVGAGLAGLAAARALVAAGVDVVVLEAAADIGGRVGSDDVDGFVVDRGFQVLNTAYPALRDHVDLQALDLRAFEPGAGIRTADGLHPMLDPRRRPASVLRTATDPLLPLSAKVRLAAFTARVVATPPRRSIAAPDTSFAQALAAAGLEGPATERFLRPFLSGVLGERELRTSARFAALVWRTFALGRVAVPSRGMRALPAHLAARLPSGTIRTGQRVEAVAPGRVTTADLEYRCAAVLVAADPVTAAELLPGLPVPAMRSLTTHYFATAQPPTRDALLHLDGTGGPICNTVVLTAAAPSYSPDHRHLVCATVLGTGSCTEGTVRAELARIYGCPTTDWEHVRTVEVPAALPTFEPPTPAQLRLPAALSGGLFVAGDHRDTPSIQGALVSGRRAGREISRHLGHVTSRA